MGKTVEQVRTDLPNLVGAVPGPRARAIIERDERAVSSSYTRCYPLVVERGEGAMVEDVDGNRFLDFNAGIAVVATGHCHPRVVEAIQRQAARLIHMSGTDFYYEGMVALAEKLARDCAGRRGAAGFLRQFGRGGDGRRHQAGALGHRARQDHRLFRQLSRAHHGSAVADRAQGGAAPRIRSAGAGRGARAVPQLLSLPVRQGAGELRGGVREAHRRHAAQDHRAGRGNGGHRGGAGAGRRRIRRAAEEVLRRAGARGAGRTGFCWCSTKCSRGWAAPAGCGRRSISTPCRTFSRWPRESPAGCRWAPRWRART